MVFHEPDIAGAHGALRQSYVDLRSSMKMPTRHYGAVAVTVEELHMTWAGLVVRAVAPCGM